MVRIARVVFVALAVVLVGAASPASAAESVDLDGSFSLRIAKPSFEYCPVFPDHVSGECGVLQMGALGAADYVYTYGPTFDSTGKKGCYFVDGTFTLTLRDPDESSITGALSGVYCRPGASDHQVGTAAYGNPYQEDDTVVFPDENGGDGTGVFAGLGGTATFSVRSAGAHGEGSLIGSLQPLA